MWCGLGIAAIYELLGKWLGKKMEKRMAGIIAGAIGLVPAVAVPAQMVSQTWDDHDRSNRYVCRDFGLNYLETIPHDGVIYTNGDNDTFPLWYNEDTEGNRTDVRVCNLSYLQTDWYIDQMKRPAFSGEGQSSPLPISWKRYQYTSGKHEMTDINPEVTIGGGSVTMKDLIREVTAQDSALAKRLWGDNPFELKTALQKFLLKDYEGLSESDKELVEALPACLPSDTLFVTIDKDAVKRSGMKIPTDTLGNEIIPEQMVISLNGQGRVSKSFIMMLEMIAQSNFSRPLYMSTTVGSSNYGNLWRHFILEGMAWRITPFVFPENEIIRGVVQSVADTEKMYDNMMNKFHYGNLKHPGLYIDETTMRMCYTHRRWFATLITNLVKEGKKDQALKALEKCETEIPAYNVPHDFSSSSLELAEAYIACGKAEKAQPILDAMIQHSVEYIKWYLSLSNVYFANSARDCHQEIYIMANIQDMYNQLAKANPAKKAEYEQKSQQIEDNLQRLYSAFVSKCEGAGIQLQ